MKFFLKLAIISGVLLSLITITILSTVDPNDYKQTIQNKVKASTGHELIIDGNLNWSLYPILGFKIGDVRLQNHPSFSIKTLFRVQESALSINLLSLLTGKIELGQLILDGVEFNVIIDQQGVSNLDYLLKPMDASAAESSPVIATDSPPKKGNSIPLSALSLSGLSITNATLQVIDQHQKNHQVVTIKKMSFEDFAFDKKTHIQLTSLLQHNHIEAKISMETDFFLDSELTTFSLTDFLIDSEVLSQQYPESSIKSQLKSGFIYDIDKQKLSMKAIRVANTLTGPALTGDVYLNISEIQLLQNNALNLGELVIASSLSGAQLQNHQLETSLQTSMTIDFNQKMANVSHFSFKNSLAGKELHGSLNLSLEDLKFIDFNKIAVQQVKLISELNGATLNKAKVNTRITMDIEHDIKTKETQVNALKGQLNKLRLSGDINLKQDEIPVIRYNLSGNIWNLSPYMSHPDDASSATAQTTSTGEQTQHSEQDLSILKRLDVEGDLELEGLIFDNLKLDKLKHHLVIKNGTASFNPLTAKLYNGRLSLRAWLDHADGENKYKMLTNIKQVQLLPLLKATANVDILSGLADITLSAEGQGLNASQLKKTINATGSLKITDGELYGINVPQELRIIKAQIRGRPLPTDKQIKKTDFASLTGKFTINNGLLNNQQLTLTSPILRLDGTGTADIINESINYKLGITPLSKSTNKTNFLDLDELVIPLLIQGPFTDPSFKLDTGNALKAQIKKHKKLLKQQADAELKRQQKKIEAKAEKEFNKQSSKLKESIKSFFD